VTFTPRQSVRAGLDHLEKRLDPIIAARLADHLNGLPWTTILVELDKARGKASRHYNSSDIQSQLRMLTERLGGLGFPFDDGVRPARLVSTLGNELRIVRNSEKHNDALTTTDAWRAHDTCVRLLEHFGDTQGANVAAQLRQAALAAVVAESGLDVVNDIGRADASAHRQALGSEADNSSLEHDSSAEAELVEPDASVLEREHSDETQLIGHKRISFEPWLPVIVGDIYVLDHIARKANKEKIRAVAQEIVEYEGPIHLDRLAQLIAASFGVQKLHTRRQQKIARQVKQIGLRIDSDKFVWPADVDPETWPEFRPNTSEVRRDFMHVSPVEIANAMRFLQHRTPDLDANDLQAATLRTFGRKRRTRNVATHLKKASALVNRRH
jgi:hypothetical protein